MPALYLSAEIMTAFAEYQQDLGVRPGTFCAYDVNVAAVPDLRDPATRAAFAIDPADLLCAWKRLLPIDKQSPPGWAIADRLTAAGASGALVPSAQLQGGVHLVLWRWNDTPDRTVSALDPRNDLAAPYVGPDHSVA